MAIIGVRNCKFNGSTCGKVTNVSVSYNFKQFSRLNNNEYRYDSATVSIVSVGGFSNDIFNISGTLTWDTVEVQDGVKKVFSNTLYNVTLQEPNLSAVTKAESVSFTTYSIVGNCHYLPYGVLRWENVTPSTSLLRTNALEPFINENNLNDHYIVTTHNDAMNLAIQFKNAYNPQISSPVFIWDNDAKKAIVVSAVQNKGCALAFDGSGELQDIYRAKNSMGTLVKSWNAGLSTSYLGNLSPTQNLFDNDDLLVTDWTLDAGTNAYTGEYSKLYNRYFLSGGFPLSETPSEGDMLWLKVDYRIYPSAYQQQAFLGFDSRSGMLWPTRFPTNFFSSRNRITVEGFATYINGVYPALSQSSPIWFYNSAAGEKDAIQIYRFYAEEIV